MAEKKKVLVVGASRGLGLALAEEYCARDWQVIATCRGSSAGLHALSKRYPSSLEIETVGGLLRPPPLGLPWPSQAMGNGMGNVTWKHQKGFEYQ
ncbi:MAG: hypothetical protein WAM50_22270 [Pseudolabrys sp.]